ncbi:hypothetical protein [Actinomyces marmotae]|uniref:hypothetical protein n=1 Tax=Actinomyces marmotae TaxID=2737173 RepID=UPI00135BD32F|nr:hypothetical protein [Actinomyces marmotae]
MSTVRPARHYSHLRRPSARSSRSRRSAGAASRAASRQAPPHSSPPDPFLPELSVRDADWLRAQMLRQVCLRFPGSRLDSPVSLRTPQGARLVLHRIAACLARTERELWEEAVGHHISGLMAAVRPDGTPRELEDYSDEEVLGALRLRLVPPSRGIPAEADEPEIAPGLRLTRVMDIGGLLISQPSARLYERLGEERVDAAALANARIVLDRTEHVGDGEGIHLIGSDSMLTAALAMSLTEVCQQRSVPHPPDGFVLALPEQESLGILPLAEGIDETHLSALLTWSLTRWGHAEHPLSALLYHVSADGAWSPLMAPGPSIERPLITLRDLPEPIWRHFAWFFTPYDEYPPEAMPGMAFGL